MSDEAQVMPEDGSGGGRGASGITGSLSYLNATWVQKRLANVMGRVDDILEGIIDFGLLSEGYGFNESPLTDEMLMKLSPEQFEALYDSEPSLEGKAMLMARIKTLKLPPRQELPPEHHAANPAPPPKLAFGVGDQGIMPSSGV